MRLHINYISHFKRGIRVNIQRFISKFINLGNEGLTCATVCEIKLNICQEVSYWIQLWYKSKGVCSGVLENSFAFTPKKNAFIFPILKIASKGHFIRNSPNELYSLTQSSSLEIQFQSSAITLTYLLFYTSNRHDQKPALHIIIERELVVK